MVFLTIYLFKVTSRKFLDYICGSLYISIEWHRPRASFIPSASQISLLNNPKLIHKPVNMGVHRASPHNEDMAYCSKFNTEHF